MEQNSIPCNSVQNEAGENHQLGWRVDKLPTNDSYPRSAGTDELNSKCLFSNGSFVFYKNLLKFN